MNELYHHGIKGQRWGVRRYQNPDGSLTAAGKRRRNLAIALSPGGYAIYKGVKTIKNKIDKHRNMSDDDKRDIAKDVKSSARKTYKYRKYLSDQDLYERINRLYNEKRLRDLMEEEDTISRYKKAATGILFSYGGVKASSALFGDEVASYTKASRSIDAPYNNGNDYKPKPNNDVYRNYINSENRLKNSKQKNHHNKG